MKSLPNNHNMKKCIYLMTSREDLGLFRLRLGICNGICCVKSLPQIGVLIVVVAREINKYIYIYILMLKYIYVIIMNCNNRL